MLQLGFFVFVVACVQPCAAAPYYKVNNLVDHINVWLCLLSYHGVVMSHIQQVHTALGVCKRSDSQAVGGMKLFHEKAAADLDDLRKLKKASSCQ